MDGKFIGIFLFLFKGVFYFRQSFQPFVFEAISDIAFISNPPMLLILSNLCIVFL